MKKVFWTYRNGVAGLTGIAVALICSTNAYATGVAAGTQIASKASATYKSGAAQGAVESNTVTVKVDELLNVAVAGLNAAAVGVGSNTVTLTYSVTNTGNGSEAFKITADPAVAGNPFDTLVEKIAVDSNGNGTYDDGVDQVLTNGAATPAIAADGKLNVFVLVKLPAVAQELQVSKVKLTATAVTGSGTPGHAFAGQGMGGGDAVVGASGATDFSENSVVANLAAVALTKSSAVSDPYGGAQPVPGAVITYTIDAAISGTGKAENLHIIDTIPTGTTYEPGSLKLDGIGLSDTADSDAGVGSSTGIDVNLGTIVGGNNHAVSFSVKIN